MSTALAFKRSISSVSMNRLEGAAAAFLQASHCDARFDLDSEVIIASRRLSTVLDAARQCELEGFSQDQILQTLEPVRRELRRGALWRRTQDWPRGYPGDYETVEMMVFSTSDGSSGRPSVYQRLAFDHPLIQQHRNKIKDQAQTILSTCASRRHEADVLVLGCGGAADLRLVLPELCHGRDQFVLCDSDSNALGFARARLLEIRARCRFVNDNALRLVSRCEQPFDLVVAGGLLDYFPTRHFVSLLKRIWVNCLKPGGRLLFTNISNDHRYKCIQKYLANWPLFERNEQELLQNLAAAGIPRNAISTMKRDDTGITIIVQILKS